MLSKIFVIVPKANGCKGWSAVTVLPCGDRRGVLTTEHAKDHGQYVDGDKQYFAWLNNSVFWFRELS